MYHKNNSYGSAYFDEEMLNASVNKEILKYNSVSCKKNKNDWLCEKCGSIYTSLFKEFHRGIRCPYCVGRKVNETNWAYSNKEMFDASVDKEFLKTVSQNSAKNNKWLCDKCNSTYESKIHNFKNGRRCPYCAKQKINHTNWAYSNKEMFDASVDKEFLKTVTENSDKQNKWKCEKCDSVYSRSIYEFNKGNKCCSSCSRSPKIIDENNWAYSNKEMFDASVDKEFLKTVTENSDKQNKWKCEKCDSEYSSKVTTFKIGIRCPYCCYSPKKINHTNWAYSNKEMFNASVDKEVLKTVGIGSKKKNKWLCDKCNSVYESSFNLFHSRGCRCPSCNNSKGERQIENILKELQIVYKTQYRINACRNKNPLPFDFALFDNDNQFIGLIEYNGKQHSEPIEFFGGESMFEYRKQNDNIKIDYCKNNDIPLLTIWHDDINIKNIISDFIGKIVIVEQRKAS